MQNTQRAYLELHVAVLLFGFTAILGDLIALPALLIVWWRVFLTSASLLLFIRRKQLRQIPRRTVIQLMGIGILVAVHWVTFYGAIKLANASIGVLAMATTSFFTAFLEPVIMRQPRKGYEIFLGILIIPGMAMVVNSMDFSLLLGLGVGLFSAFLVALFNTLNKKFVAETDPLSITFLELSSAWLFLCFIVPPFLWSQGGQVSLWPPTVLDWIYLLVLSLLCTTLAYVLAVRSLRFLSAFAANLTINLEPVYGIILAWVILHENQELSPNFYWGGVIIIGTVFSYPLLRRWFAPKELP